MAITPKPQGSISTPNTVPASGAGSVSAPNNLPASSAGNVEIPNSLTTKAKGNVATPNIIAPDTAGTISVPNNLNDKAAIDIAVPNSLTPEAAGSILVPNSIPASSAGAISVPVNIPAVSSGNITAPNALASSSASILPRTLTPLVNIDFANQCYAQCGAPILFDDLFTYSRPSSATFINRIAKCSGGYDYFVDTNYVGDATNLIPYSEQLSNTAWSKLAGGNGISPSVVNTTSVAPDGTIGVNEITFNANGIGGSDLSYVQQSVPATTQLNASIWIKNISGFNQEVILRSGGTDKAIIPTDKWIRYEVSAATLFDRIAVIARGDKTGSSSVKLLLWGAQLTESAKPLPYVKTLVTPATETFTESLRFEYDPETDENLGALVEGASTNLSLRSEEFDNAVWNKVVGGSGIVPAVTNNALLAPDGTLSADRIVFNTGGISGGDLSYIQQFIVATTELTASIWLKSATGGNSLISLRCGGTDNILTVTNEWKRFETKALTNFDRIALIAFGSQQSSVDLYVWGAQLESLPFASSYIRTEGSVVSRSADDLSLPSAGNFNTSEYTLSLSINIDHVTTSTMSALVVGGISDRTQIDLVNGNLFRPFSLSGGGVQFSVNGSSVPVNVTTNLVLSFIPDNMNMYFNGNNNGSDSSCIQINEFNTIFLGSLGASQKYYGHIVSFSSYDQALTAQEVKLL